MPITKNSYDTPYAAMIKVPFKIPDPRSGSVPIWNGSLLVRRHKAKKNSPEFLDNSLSYRQIASNAQWQKFLPKIPVSAPWSESSTIFHHPFMRVTHRTRVVLAGTPGDMVTEFRDGTKWPILCWCATASRSRPPSLNLPTYKYHPASHRSKNFIKI